MNAPLRWWRTAWRAPGASLDDHRRHDVRRLHDMSPHMLVSAVSALLVLTLSQLLPWEAGRGSVRALWALVLLLHAAVHLGLWWRCGRRASVSRLPVWVLPLVLANLAVTGLSYGLVGAHLLGWLDEGLRLVTIGVLAAVLGAGAWLFAMHAACGLVWVWSLAPGLLTGMLAFGAPRAGLLALLVLPYAGFLSVMVLVAARQRLALLAQQDEIERQRGMLGLLLRDFEADANDWLWELDARGALQHVSVRLAEAAELPAQALRGRLLVEVLADLGAVGVESLSLALRRARPFGELLLPWLAQGERRWWSLKARPLFGEFGELLGWRGVTSDVTTLRRHEEELTRLATRDTLTGLANRHVFYQDLGRRLPQGCAVMLIDLDNFKQVNDTLGHAAGDALLQELAMRWLPLVPHGALLARLGGDEFGLLVRPGEDVDALAQRFMRALQRPIRVAERDLMVGMSLGTACAPLDAGDAERLLGRADVALYAAKAGGRGRLVHFHLELERDAERRLRLSSDLRDALQRNDGALFTVYQPKVDLLSGRLVGFEALSRWHHAQLGLVPPAEFIPLAEEGGLVLLLGEQVLRRACADAAHWPSHLEVAVNVSALQVARGGLARLVASALQDSGLAPERLELELTESAFLAGSETLMALLGELRQLGVRVALDDFGTGYSSLAYLQALPLNTLKIDRSFVMDLAGDGAAGKPGAIVHTIVQLAQAIGADTVAEGVESEAQRQRLIELGCRVGQGYLFSRPITAAEAARVADETLKHNPLPGSSHWAGLH